MNIEEKNIDDLRWVRVFTPIHIPKYLIENVRDRDFTVEDFYKYQEVACIRETEEGPTLNPLSHLYVLVDKDNMTKGFLWFTIDSLSKDLVIQTYSVDKAYWGFGKAVKKVTEHILEIWKRASLNKIYWITRYPKHSERYGFKKSENVLMEYSGENREDKKESVEDVKKTEGEPHGKISAGTHKV